MSPRPPKSRPGQRRGPSGRGDRTPRAGGRASTQGRDGRRLDRDGRRPDRDLPRPDRDGRRADRNERSQRLTVGRSRPPRDEQAELPLGRRSVAPTSREPASDTPARREGSRFVYGVNPVLEAIRAHADEIDGIWVAEGQVPQRAAAEIFSRASKARIRVAQVPRERLTTLAEGGVHQGVVAEMRAFKYAELEDIIEAANDSGRPALVVVLDGIQDPQNLGAIVRSAHALGAHGVVIGRDRAAGVTGAAVKASAGALEHCQLARVVNISRALEELKGHGLWVAAADPKGEQPLWSARLDGPIALVVGAEGTGIREGVREHCDFRLNVPMAGNLASLNASVSAAVLLYEVNRQRSIQPAPAIKS